MAKMAFSLEEAPCGSTRLLHSLAVPDRGFGSLEQFQIHIEEKAGVQQPRGCEEHPTSHLFHRNPVEVHADPLAGISLFDLLVVGFQGSCPGLDAGRQENEGILLAQCPGKDGPGQAYEALA